MALYQSGTGLSAMIGIGTTNPTSNLNVVGNVYATNNIITNSSFYGILAGSNTISASVITVSNINATTMNSTTSNTSTLFATNYIAAPGFYGGIIGSNAITCTYIQSTGGTIQTSFSQGVNAPNLGQAYFYNPTNAANQDASVGVRLAGSSARNCYYSYDISGVGGFSHGILGSNQNLVFRASWDMTTATIFTMDRSGNFTASASVSANSDRRIKTDLQVIPNALEKVKRISGYTFKRTDADLPRQAGVIAQELLEVLPEVVHKNDEGIYSVSYGNIVALLIEALKEESAKREELEKKLHYSSIVVNCGESVIHI